MREMVQHDSGGTSKHMAKVHNVSLELRLEDGSTCTTTCSTNQAHSSSSPCNVTCALSVNLDSFINDVSTPLGVLEGIWKKATVPSKNHLARRKARSCKFLLKQDMPLQDVGRASKILHSCDNHASCFAINCMH